jgi:hypothetical protein
MPHETHDDIASRIAGPQPEKASFAEVFSAVRRDERFGHEAIYQLFNGRELADQDAQESAAQGGWNPEAALRDAISGQEPDKAAFLVENGWRGPASLRRAQARWAAREDTDRTVASAGAVVGTLASVAGDLTNPVAAAAGMLGGYAVMGGRALLAARAGGAAVRTGVVGARAAPWAARLADEAVGGVLGSVAYSAIQDTLGGQVMDIGDYAVDAAADAAGTVALFGAAKGATWAVRKLAAAAHVQGAPSSVGALRDAGLEPPFTPPDRPTPPEVAANAQQQAEVAARAVAEVENPPAKSSDDLFDETYRKTLLGEDTSSPTPPAKTPAEEAIPGLAVTEVSPEGVDEFLRVQRSEWNPPGGAVRGATDDPVSSASWKADGNSVALREVMYPAIASGQMDSSNIWAGDLPKKADGTFDVKNSAAMAPVVEESAAFAQDLLSRPLVRGVAVAVHPSALTRGVQALANNLAEELRGMASKYLPDTNVRLGLAPVLNFNTGTRGAAWGAPQGHIISIRADLDGTTATRTLIHEVGHVVMMEYGRFLNDAEFSRLRDAYRAFVIATDPSERALMRFAPGNSALTTVEGTVQAGKRTDDYFVNLAEFGAEQFVKFVQKDPAGSGLPERTWAGIQRAVAVVMRVFMDAKQRKLLDAEEAFEDFFQSVLDGKMQGRVAREGAGSPNQPVGVDVQFDADDAARKKAAGKVVGSVRAQATDRMRKGLYDRAAVAMANKPIRTERLRTMNQHLGGGLSDGLILAGEANPGIQLLASRLSETTTGAAGRGDTAAVIARYTQEKIAGRMLRSYTAAWHDWSSANGVVWFRRFGQNEQRTRFDLEVQAEMYRRRSSPEEVLPEYSPVRRAADALDALNSRAAKEGRAAGILGAANLPEGDSRGYWTQRLDGRRVIEATPEQRGELAVGLTEHFQKHYTLEPTVAAAVADVYIRNAIAKIHGTGTVQVDVQGSVVRSIREEMEHIADGISDPVLKEKLLESTQGMSNTRRRLDIPWDNAAVSRFFDSDMVGLARGYTRRMAAEIGTTRTGMLGLKGVRELRAAALSNGPVVSERAVQALDRIIAEMFGTPVPGAVTSVAASNARSLTAMVRLGGAVFAQAGDMMNVAAALGTASAFRSITNLPRLVLDLKRMVGGAETASILQGVDRAGGQIGLRQYLIEAPLAPSDDMLSEYTRTPGILTQLIQHAGYASQSINFFRGFLAVQHRHVAEEVLKHVVDAHVSGSKLSTAVKDMGFTDELVASLSPAVKLDGKGRVTGFDPALLPEEKAQQFMVSLHRGVGQMIQSNFAGENSSWAHNDWVKIMTQFRTFSLTANEKQIARRRANASDDGGMADGYAHVVGHLTAQMAVGSLLYLGRVQVGLLGLDKRERAKKAKAALGWPAVVQGSLNASTLSGFTGDAWSALSALKGWLPEDVQAASGLRGARPGSLPETVPVIGLAAQAGKALQNPTARKLTKLLPGANAPLVIPFLNMLPD